MREKFPWWKLIAGYLFFIFFHQIYDILGGGTLATILGEGIESIYAHMKMYFHAYLLVCLIDYFLRRRQLASASSFWYPRMLIAASFPWMSIAIWFIPVALGFELGKYELIYSFVLTALGLYLAFRLEEGLAGVEFRPALKAMIWLAFIAAFITYIGFSFHVPENFFRAPE
jgi:purine-cytosine permease-like protein